MKKKLLNLKRDLIKVNIFFHPVMGLRALPGKSAQINYQHSLVRVRSIVHAAWVPVGQCGRARVLGVKHLFFQRLGLLTCVFFASFL